MIGDVKTIVAPDFQRETILLVDDNLDDVFIMRSTFKKAGVVNPLQTVGDGELAIAYIRGDAPYTDRQQYPSPIAVFLDLNMPKKNGLEVLSWVRAQPSLQNMMVHILTASSRPVDVEQAFALGANSYLIKPSRLEALVQLVGAWYQLAQFSAFVLPGGSPREETLSRQG